MIDLNALKILLDDDVLVLKYIDRFTVDMPDLILRMRNASENLRWNDVSMYAHTYKCQMQYIHETVAAEIAYTVEQASAMPEPEAEHINPLIRQLEVHLEEILPSLRQLIG